MEFNMKLALTGNKMIFKLGVTLAFAVLLCGIINASTCTQSPFKLLSSLYNSAGSLIRLYTAIDPKLCQRTCRQYFECTGLLMKWPYGENQQVGDCHLLSVILVGNFTQKDNESLYAHGYRDCGALYDTGFTESGMYTIQVDSFRKQVYCDMDTNGGGWTVVLQRLDGSLDFNRFWMHYKNGFGDAAGEYWLGNEPVHILTSAPKTYTLRFDLTRFNGEKGHAEYPDVVLSYETENYAITFGAYSDSGTLGDAFGVNQGMLFTTRDNDNDDWSSNSAQVFKGGWWFKDPGAEALGTGRYGQNITLTGRGIRWVRWLHNNHPKIYSMKIKATT